MDKNAYRKFKRAYHKDINSLENYFIKRGDTIFNHNELGFGWRMWETKSGGGNVTIHGKFYYLNDSIVSYKITPETPNNDYTLEPIPRLAKKYKRWYKTTFPLINDTIRPIEYNINLLCVPLHCSMTTEQISSTPLIFEYMSPETSIYYSCSQLEEHPYSGNREAFNKLKDSLSSSQLLLLMHSLNPASRFTAIEFYLSNKNKFSDLISIQPWIDSVFNDIPTIVVFDNSKFKKLDSRTAVTTCSQSK